MAFLEGMLSHCVRFCAEVKMVDSCRRRNKISTFFFIADCLIVNYQLLIVNGSALMVDG